MRQDEGGRQQEEGEGGEVSNVKHLEAGWSTREFEDTRSHKGRGTPFYQVDSGSSIRAGPGLSRNRTT